MPHRMVDQVADGLANAAAGLVGGLGGAVKGVGKSVMSGLDQPLRAMDVTEGPHRVADPVLDGIVDAAMNFPNSGIIGSLKIVGKGIMRGLDQPVKQISAGPAKIKFPEFLGRR